MLAWQVLIQRSAERDIEDLDSATDREHRQASITRGLEQREFGCVARRVDFAELRMRRRAVTFGIDVLAPGEQETAD
jgi:hypothetical protein